MMNPGGLRITAQGDRELVMTREFAAPRQLVFDAWTKPALLERWLGVHNGWRLEICEVDLRVGGRYRFVWRGPDRAEMGLGGVYTEVVVPERFVATERFDQSWYPGEAVGTLVLVETAGRTRLTHTMRYESKDARDAVLASPMESGVAAGYDTLDKVLAALTVPQR